MSDWRRLDPRMLAIRPIDGLIRAALPILAIFVSGRNDGPGQLISVGIAVLVILVGMSHWFTTRYRIGDGQVELRTGLLRRRHLAVPLDRVRSVDVTAARCTGCSASPSSRSVPAARTRAGATSCGSTPSPRTRRRPCGPSSCTAARRQPVLPTCPSSSRPRRCSRRSTPAGSASRRSPSLGWRRSARSRGYVFHLLNEAHIDPGAGGFGTQHGQPRRPYAAAAGRPGARRRAARPRRGLLDGRLPAGLLGLPPDPAPRRHAAGAARAAHHAFGLARGAPPARGRGPRTSAAPRRRRRPLHRHRDGDAREPRQRQGRRAVAAARAARADPPGRRTGARGTDPTGGSPCASTGPPRGAAATYAPWPSPCSSSPPWSGSGSASAARTGRGGSR